MIENSRSDAYAQAGVDITAGYRAVELMKSHIARTQTKGVCSGIGGFGGDRKSTRLNSSHPTTSRMPSSA